MINASSIYTIPRYFNGNCLQDCNDTFAKYAVKAVFHKFSSVHSRILCLIFSSLGYIWLFLTFVEDSLESYVRMMVLEKKLLKYFYTDLSFLRDDEVFVICCAVHWLIISFMVAQVKREDALLYFYGWVFA